jgi:hypothetical protein
VIRNRDFTTLVIGLVTLAVIVPSALGYVEIYQAAAKAALQDNIVLKF